MEKRILVVDDDPPVVELVREVLTRAGFSVSTAADGPACLRKVTEETPDLIVLDINMPDMDGFTVLRKLRERPATKDLPVILLTVREGHGDVLQGWLAGANLYMSKPCSPTELVAAVRQMLEAPASL